MGENNKIQAYVEWCEKVVDVINFNEKNDYIFFKLEENGEVEIARHGEFELLGKSL